MNQPQFINIVVEDLLTELTIKKILNNYKDKFQLHNIFGKRGFGYIKSRITNFNAAAKNIPYLIITDLDQYDCPPSLCKEWFTFTKNPNLIFRIAVKEIETWLIADRKNFSGFLKIPENRISKEVESISDPKEFIIKLATRSPNREMRSSIVPKLKSTAKIGPNYNDCLARFIINYWDIDLASMNSISLHKTLESLNNFHFRNPGN
jgi:hypothetical protein